jgi:hypothetical protein
MIGGPTQVALRNFLIRGRAGGAWNGTSTLGAIHSSLAAGTSISDGVGYGLGAQVAPTTIGSFSIGPTDLLTRYAHDGDANLDHQVNLADFNRLATDFGQAGRAWTEGESNYDGTVNLSDFNALAGNFGSTATGPNAGPDLPSDKHLSRLRRLLEELV